MASVKLGGRADLDLPDKARYLGPTSNSGPSFCVLLGTHFAFHDHSSLIIPFFFWGNSILEMIYLQQHIALSSVGPQTYRGPLDIVIAQNINNKSHGADSGN